jgi:putative transposase
MWGATRCGRTWSPRRRTGDGVRSGQDRIAGARLAYLLSPWPVEMPARWTTMVNQVQNEKELAALHRARDRGQPYGQDRWVQKTASALGIESSLRPPGRPKKQLLEKNGL